MPWLSKNVKPINLKHILVTCASGMIGVALVERLRLFACPVTAIGGRAATGTAIDANWILGSSMGEILRGVDTADHIFHLANPECLSTLELSEMIGTELGIGLRCWPMPPNILKKALILVGRESLADGLASNMLVDTSKICLLLGWNANQPIRKAISEALSSLA